MWLICVEVIGCLGKNQCTICRGCHRYVTMHLILFEHFYVKMQRCFQTQKQAYKSIKFEKTFSPKINAQSLYIKPK